MDIFQQQEFVAFLPRMLQLTSSLYQDLPNSVLFYFNSSILGEGEFHWPRWSCLSTPGSTSYSQVGRVTKWKHGQFSSVACEMQSPGNGVAMSGLQGRRIPGRPEPFLSFQVFPISVHTCLFSSHQSTILDPLQ